MPTNKPLEKSIENILRKAVEDEGGVCLKWTCPGHRGVPDRMILFPGGIIAFVELKRPGAKVKAGGLQEWWRMKILKRHRSGVLVFVVVAFGIKLLRFRIDAHHPAFGDRTRHHGPRAGRQPLSVGSGA